MVIEIHHIIQTILFVHLYKKYEYLVLYGNIIFTILNNLIISILSTIIIKNKI